MKNATEKYAEVFKALSHPVRCEIMILLDQHDRTVQELYEKLHRRQSNISQHLQVLRDKGMLTFRIRGRHRIYTLNDEQHQLVEYLLKT